MSLNLLKKLAKRGYGTIEESKIFNIKDPIRMNVPVLNLALNGSFNGGLKTGTTILAGPSSSFKTGLLLEFIRDFQKKYLTGIVIFVDGEGGTNPNMLKNFGIDISRVVYIDVESIGDAHHKIMDIFHNVIAEGEDVFLAFDSLGNIPTANEIKRALEDKITPDVGNRPKELKAMFRTISRPIRHKDVYAVFLNHTYDPPEMYARRVMGGGSGPMYDAQTVIFLDKRVMPKELRRSSGDNRFSVYIHKSREVLDRSEFFIDVYQGSGIDRTSHLETLAKEADILRHNSGQWWKYNYLDETTGEILEETVSKSDLSTIAFWSKAITNKLFTDFIESRYLINIDEINFESEEDIFAQWDEEDKNESIEEVATKAKKSTKKKEETE